MSGKLHFNCSYCGKSFDKWPCYVKSINNFCSQKCNYRFKKGRHMHGNTEKCVICKKTFWIKPFAVKRGTKCCSVKCSKEYKKTLTGEKSANWKGGIYRHTGGYLEQPITQKRGLAKRMLMHRRVYENYHGVKLGKKFVVHHIDGDKTNNDINNLMAMTKSEHAKLHCNFRKIKKL